MNTYRSDTTSRQTGRYANYIIFNRPADKTQIAFTPRALSRDYRYVELSIGEKDYAKYPDQATWVELEWRGDDVDDTDNLFVMDDYGSLVQVSGADYSWTN